jgi:hypothetical protein
MEYMRLLNFGWFVLLYVTVCLPIKGYGRQTVSPVTYREGNLEFAWEPGKDKATVMQLPGRTVIWQGSLLPAFWLQADGKKEFVKTSVSGSNGQGQLQLQVGRFGTGQLTVVTEPWGVRFSALVIEWKQAAPAIIEMYFGASGIDMKNTDVWPLSDRPFMPDWQAFGFCVPGAKGGPAQSFFRSWDFGQANIALGSFGPSMGSPYGAAYPKPVYFAGMGSNEGFISLGAGTIPDAAMSLYMLSARGCLRYVYHEEIWGALPNGKRVWQEPLRITVGLTAMAAFRNYYRSFPVQQAHAPVVPPQAFFNTWGLWRERNYTLDPLVRFARKLGAAMLVLDDGWESSQGSGAIHTRRFPGLPAYLKRLTDSGMTHGLWETIGWIDDTLAAGLTSADLIVDRNGRPCKANWNFDPLSPAYYCLDISSDKTKAFLAKRTRQVMQQLQPSLLKLDFGYGLPSPIMGVPRDLKYRGDRQVAEIIGIIAKTAKSVNPSVKLLYYGISPLCLDQVDMISLDDQGDLWYDIAKGHGEWSIWASLLGDRNVLLTGSSGYNWESDEEVILNTAVIGVPGATLSITESNGRPVRDRYLNRRLAINTWFRRTALWQPLWLNSHTGNMNTPPQLNCWGRMEGKSLTSLVVREGARADTITESHIGNMRWKGRWALIAQDDKDIFLTSKLALIPFDAGELVIPCAEKPLHVTRLSMSGEAPYDNWEWTAGRLSVIITGDMLEHTAGFLVSK